MRKVEVEILSDAVNAAVIKLPGRKFPGIVIQGDSLKLLLDSTLEASELAHESGNLSIEESLSDLVQLLRGYLDAYEGTLREQNHPLPYST
jgi:hypothetical protein